MYLSINKYIKTNITLNIQLIYLHTLELWALKHEGLQCSLAHLKPKKDRRLEITKFCGLCSPAKMTHILIMSVSIKNSS